MVAAGVTIFNNLDVMRCQDTKRRAMPATFAGREAPLSVARGVLDRSARLAGERQCDVVGPQAIHRTAARTRAQGAGRAAFGAMVEEAR